MHSRGGALRGHRGCIESNSLSVFNWFSSVIKDEKEGEQSTFLKRESDLSHGSSMHDVDPHEGQEEVKVTGDEEVTSSVNRCCVLFLDSFLTLRRGWRIYINQTFVFAGLGLATLYMTVLGFDNITTGKISSPSFHRYNILHKLSQV